ncbi:hypothetical protein GYMLUDRAFT_49789 [Collybiopsis luxurians FD-317 M1]|uniref:Unplaced genomic scaffold GYMLUscaffold_90, whole genome shotgun sequence n=1 Tax=Collybiopsis luxurians FD-317 M1 TaxID=944289 RepID=A0A0D0AQX1_9AGAR|nr:hypothetical protein GYMLUDRAFT_49789 [Collybiopsis luxurians FD-317 M1]
MSSAIVQELQSGIAGNYAFTAAATLWIAGYLETVTTEINVIWLKRQTGTSLLFVLNRYSFLLSLLVTFMVSFPGESTDQECNSLHLIILIAGFIASATTDALFALRVYAIYDKSRSILVISSFFLLSKWVMGTMSSVLIKGISTTGYPIQAIVKCADYIENNNVYDRVQLGIPIITLAFEVFMFILTLRKTFHHSFEMKRLGESSISQVVLQDGILYFLIQLVLGVLDATAKGVQLLVRSKAVKNLGFSVPFFNIVPNMLISHLMLNLRTFSSPEATDSMVQSTEGQQYSGMHFATNSFLGNIGAPLDRGDFEEEDWDGHE